MGGAARRHVRAVHTFDRRSVWLIRGGRESGGAYHVWRRDGRIVADRSNLCVKVLGDKMAQQARTGASLHKRAVYRARN